MYRCHRLVLGKILFGPESCKVPFNVVNWVAKRASSAKNRRLGHTVTRCRYNYASHRISLRSWLKSYNSTWSRGGSYTATYICANRKWYAFSGNKSAISPRATRARSSSVIGVLSTTEYSVISVTCIDKLWHVSPDHRNSSFRFKESNNCCIFFSFEMSRHPGASNRNRLTNFADLVFNRNRNTKKCS